MANIVRNRDRAWAIVVAARSVQVVAAIAFVVGAFWFVISVGTKTSPESQETAAWVQAFGSVIAIGASAWLVDLGWRRERHRRWEVESSRILAIHEVVQAAMIGSAKITAAIETTDADVLSEGHEELVASEAMFVLDKLLISPVETWPSPVLYLKVRRLWVSLDHMERGAYNYLPDLLKYPNNWKILEKRRVQVQICWLDYIEDLEKNLNAAMHSSVGPGSAVGF